MGKLGVDSGRNPQAHRKVDAKGCPPSRLQRAPRQEQRRYPRNPAVIPVIPIPGPAPDSPRHHRDPLPVAASGFRRKPEAGRAIAGGAGGAAPAPTRGVRGVVPPRAAMLRGAGARINLMQFLNQ